MKFNAAEIFEEVPGLYKIIPLNILRRTRGVAFDNVPTEAMPRIDAIDRVIHASSAVSPRPVGEVAAPGTCIPIRTIIWWSCTGPAGGHLHKKTWQDRKL
jgi:hypothetical protein